MANRIGPAEYNRKLAVIKPFQGEGDQKSTYFIVYSYSATNTK